MSDNKRGPRILDEDRDIAPRLRNARIMAGVSQKALAETLGVTWQQVAKRESGHNRISVGALIRTAKILGTSVESILDPDNDAPKVSNRAIGMMRLFALLSTRHQADVVRYARTLAGIVGEE